MGQVMLRAPSDFMTRARVRLLQEATEAAQWGVRAPDNEVTTQLPGL